ncbi:YT521-B-like domain-containing protein [Corynascus novoguineensis]|uniref:YT521-B-like domain-containing protein n=1 Tax=Corynascus novoguineensis TaxID=1126955 RepID=A0AAN7HRZ0_9PEZI|nr:YT521-B-like domain-containing protein [Corynascus novoguineensis]
MTDYFNVEARTRKLDRFRRAKALAAERQRIEEEERKLREEEELDMDFQRSNMARLTGAASVLESNSLPTPVTPLTKSLNDDEIRATPLTNPTKRARDPETSPEARQDKVPRLGAAPPSRPKDIEDRTRGDDRRHWHESGRDLSPRHNDRYRQSSPANPPYRQENDSEDRRKYDRYKGDDGRYLELERRQSYPIHVDLGRKGDTRFFILKSFNDENVRRCMEDNLWTTQIQNAEILAKAFAKCKNVILFFSVNKSKAFQGYARMTSAPSPDNPLPSFVKGLHWETSDPFRVRWLSKTTVEFWRIGHIKNPYNDYLPVLVGKDGQEIEEECGAALLREMEDITAATNDGGRGYGGKHGPLPDGYQQGKRGSGGYHGDRYGRREGDEIRR